MLIMHQLYLVFNNAPAVDVVIHLQGFNYLMLLSQKYGPFMKYTDSRSIYEIYIEIKH